jgi:hypothetical protein
MTGSRALGVECSGIGWNPRSHRGVLACRGRVCAAVVSACPFHLSPLLFSRNRGRSGQAERRRLRADSVLGDSIRCRGQDCTGSRDSDRCDPSRHPASVYIAGFCGEARMRQMRVARQTVPEASEVIKCRFRRWSCIGNLLLWCLSATPRILSGRTQSLAEGH